MHDTSKSNEEALYQIIKKKKNPRKISSERNLSPTHADHDAAQVPFEGYALSPA